jgi:hypothetical protein
MKGLFRLPVLQFSMRMRIKQSSYKRTSIRASLKITLKIAKLLVV